MTTSPRVRPSPLWSPGALHRSIALTAVAMGLLLVLGACSGDERDVDNVTDVLGVGDIVDAPAWRNVCQGLDPLTWQGAAALPGERCGPCDDGLLACAGPEALMCLGNSDTNLCGGCGKLQGIPGQRCGACGIGAWVCAEDGASVTCEGARGQNACGGCAVLPADPGDACGTARIPASWRCMDPESVRCIQDDQNACGGTAELDGAPGALCGTCGRGTLACASEDTLVCLDADAGINACGGCALLGAAPGDPCAPCGGEWECADGRLICSRTRNVCGGCDEVEGEPGDTCGVGGALVCDGFRSLTCADESVNACGGETALDTPPGRPCGPCADGRYVCLSPELTACVGGTTPNACGLCGDLDGTPGTPCAASAIWVCSAEGVTCSNELGLNACGGLTEFPEGGAPGDPCGVCDSGALVCAGANAVRCEGGLDEDDFTFWPDLDEDGFGDDDAEPVVACEAPAGYVGVGGDCDDSDPAFNPDAVEDPCLHNVDLNCDGVITFDDADRDGSPTCVDCDDNDPRTYPGAPETCDGVDNDCDDIIDEGVGRTWYRDADGDGRGTADEQIRACSRPDGYSAADDDCDDDDPLNFPRNREVCDGQDNNCDNVIDGDDAADRVQWYRDADGDGFGDPTTAPIIACDRPDGYVDNALDCDDGNDAIKPGATEVCDGIDNDCNGLFDDGAVDRQLLHRDADGDGFGDPARAELVCPGQGWVDNGADCDDRRRDVYPGAPEIPADGVDQDCDALEHCYVDFDGDGYIGDFSVEIPSPDLRCRVVAECPAGYVKPDASVEGCQLSLAFSALLDCDDGDPFRNPGAREIFGDGVDQNCDFTEVCYRDMDGDGYRPLADDLRISLDPDCDDDGEAYALDPVGDCNDQDPLIRPGVAEIAGDLVDQNCDNRELCYVNADNDPYRTTATRTVFGDIACAGPGLAPASVPPGDCDDTRPTVYPGAFEVVGNAIDNDCDGFEVCYLDVDRDGWRGTLTVSTTNIACNGEFTSDEILVPADLALAASPAEFQVCDSDANRNPGRPDPADDNAFDQNCDLRDGNLAADRYVSGGTSADIQAAIDACAGSSACRNVFVAVGEYRTQSPLVLRSGVNVHGGYIATDIDGDGNADAFAGRRFGSTSGADWLLDPSAGGQALEAQTWLNARGEDFCSNPGAASCGGAAVAVRAFNMASGLTELAGVRIEAPHGEAGTGQGSVGVHVLSASAFRMRRALVRAGNGGAGRAGSNGANGATGSSTSSSSGAGSSCGAWGGSGSSYTSVSYDDDGNRCHASYFLADSGGTGRNGVPSGGGGGTGSSVCKEVCDGANCPGSSGGGGGGGGGNNGSCAATGGSNTSSLVGAPLLTTGAWIGQYGSAGANGADASGGGGGGRGGYYICDNEGGFICGGSSLRVQAGGTGGGGGAGGCRGNGGGGGEQGGASIGVLAYASANAQISSVRVIRGAGGAGGRGGNGGSGGSGGTGRAGYGGEGSAAGGGRGGDGGSAGGGSGGAGGHGGPSWGVAQQSANPLALTAVTYEGGAGGSAGAGGTGGSGPWGCTAATGGAGSVGESANTRSF